MAKKANTKIKELANHLNVRSPYTELVEKSKANNLYKTITGVEFMEASNRLNERTESKIAKVQFLEREARIKSAKWIIK